MRRVLAAARLVLAVLAVLASAPIIASASAWRRPKSPASLSHMAIRPLLLTPDRPGPELETVLEGFVSADLFQLSTTDQDTVEAVIVDEVLNDKRSRQLDVARAVVLVGVVEGPISSAVLEGLPGVAGGRALRVKDVVGDLRVVEIRGREVRLALLDTTWTVRLRERAP